MAKNILSFVEFQIGDIVFGKVRGYAFWSGKVEEKNGTKIRIAFFDPEIKLVRKLFA